MDSSYSCDKAPYFSPALWDPYDELSTPEFLHVGFIEIFS